MIPLVYAQRAAELPFWLTTGIWAIGERFLTFRDLRSGAWRSRQDRGSYLWLVLAVAAGFGAAIALSMWHALEPPAPWVWLVVGLVIAWAGMLLRAWAVVTLGRSFTTTVVVRPEQRMVTTGPYRLIRHPSYLGLLIFFLGFGLGLGNPLCVPAIVVLSLIGLVRRIAVEEAALRRELGDSYVEYARGRSRLIPGVW
ncbi:MAG TPA: isoprenylcysteine carboxylmethyltransferase family protein [Candidatus Dormibacteraeota bacterium]|nr:isoprenylcysteine carboxylmethyltransferase family protein [Candidatus Dormibacteraeota bacterium]